MAAPLFCVPPLQFFPRDTRDADAEGEIFITRRGYFLCDYHVIYTCFHQFPENFWGFPRTERGR